MFHEFIRNLILDEPITQPVACILRGELRSDYAFEVAIIPFAANGELQLGARRGDFLNHITDVSPAGLVMSCLVSMQLEDLPTCRELTLERLSSLGIP